MGLFLAGLFVGLFVGVVLGVLGFALLKMAAANNREKDGQP